jgi:glycosyltransferase involved in cell wall biosynthesis
MVKEAVTVIIPAYNEVEGLAAVLPPLQRSLETDGIPHEIIIVNDGSTDGTETFAATQGLRVLTHVKNRGYGAALKTGILAASHERLVTIDADGTYPPEAIPALLNELDHAEMVVGARRISRWTGPWSRKMARWALGALANYLAGLRIPDVNSGLRTFQKTSVLRYFHLLPNTYSFSTTLTLALLSDRRTVRYLSVEYHERIGRSKASTWDAIQFPLLVLRLMLLFKPLRIFGPLAAFTGSAALMKGGWDFRSASGHLSTSTLMLLGGSTSLLLIGLSAALVSDKIRKIRTGSLFRKNQNRR